MGQYINRLYCMMVAMVSAYIVNMVYHMESAVAAGVTCPPGTSCHSSEISWNCQMYNGTTKLTEWKNGTSNTNPEYGIMAGYCNPASAVAILRGGSVPNGYTVYSCFSDNGGDNSGRSGRASCAYTSCIKNVSVSPTTKTLPCGVATVCGASTVTASCYMSGNAGFLINGGKGCDCCANSTGFIASYKPIGMSNVFSIYNAAAKTSCYIVGQFEDSTGLFEFTDNNRCYYAS